MGQVTVTLTGDEARLLRSIDKVVQKEKELARRIKETGQASEQANRKTEEGLGRLGDRFDKTKQKREETFGSSAVQELAQYAAGFTPVLAILNEIRQAITAVDEARSRAAGEARSAEMSLGALAQLAKSPEEFKKLTAMAEQTLREGGAKDLNEAAGLVFSLGSAGALDERSFFAQLPTIGMDPTSLVKSASQLRTALGEEEVGSFRDLTSKVIAASAFSPDLPGPLLQGAARGAAPARLLGVSDEELLAATAITATTADSAAQGGTQIRSFLKSLVKQGGFEGLGISESVRRIDQMGLSNQDLVKFFGEQEALAGFSALKAGLPSGEGVDSISAAIAAAQEDDVVGQKLAMSGASPVAQAARQARIAEARATASRTGLGIQGNEGAAAIATIETMLREAGVGEASVASTVNDIQRGTFGVGGDVDRVALRQLGMMARSQRGEAPLDIGLSNFTGPSAEDLRALEEEGRQAILAELRRQTDAIVENTEATRASGSPPALAQPTEDR